MSGHIIFEIGLRVSKRNTVLLEKRMNLKARLESEEAPNLALGQSSGPVAFDRDRFERLPV